MEQVQVAALKGRGTGLWKRSWTCYFQGKGEVLSRNMLKQRIQVQWSYGFGFCFLPFREWAAETCTDCLAFRKCSSHPGFYISPSDSYLSLTPKACMNFSWGVGGDFSIWGAKIFRGQIVSLTVNFVQPQCFGESTITVNRCSQPQIISSHYFI